MNWTQWDIGTFDFPAPVGEHPVVIISNADRAGRSKIVNVLYCTSQKQNRPVGAEEVLLDAADGMDWETYCRCDHIFSVERDKIKTRPKPARITAARRVQIAAKIVEVFRLKTHA
jgi:mRNA-degrading endonuclease toxin of MazEF toxin-antitoxin module